MLLQHYIDKLGTVLVLVTIFFVGYQIFTYIYNIFLHPLRRFPGPVTTAASTWPKINHAIRGDLIYWIVELHAKFGEVVRVSPNELSFSGADAWKDIYGHSARLPKDPSFYESPEDGVTHIVNSNAADHTRMRRIFAHAFSDSALKKQESLFLKYVDQLVQKMKQVFTADPEHKFNMVDMYNFTTFDIMGDLTFGDPLQMLADSSYHPWVSAIFANFKIGTYLHCIRYFPALEALLFRFVPQSLKEKQRLHDEFSVARVNQRLQQQDTRPDIWGLVLEKHGDSGLTKREMYANANLFMIGGTETTATLLCGLTYHLLRNPTKLKQLTDEIRGAFESEESITIERLQRLNYLHSCIEEGLRMYPPISNGLPRIVPPIGAQIGGMLVPARTQVYVTNLASYRNTNNFRSPLSFIPERWFSDEYANDKKHALQPFSLGPRSCLGKNMAYHETRLILSKVLWNFDLKLCSESESWIDQKIFLMWEKRPLWCQISPARG